MKAIVDDAVVADAPESDLISIEGNYYFPPWEGLSLHRHQASSPLM